MGSRRVVVVLALVALLSASCGGEPPGATATGRSLLPSDPAALPTFDLARYEALLAELEGRPVLVNIWASWCGPCRQEAPHLSAAHAEYGDRVQFLGIDILDSRESARGFMREVGWTYPSVFDPRGEIRDGLGLLGQPVTLFYDRSGALIQTWVGPIDRQSLSELLEDIVAA